MTSAAVVVESSVGIDELLDDHAVEFEECRRWANSDAGQTAKVQNPAGFANVRRPPGRTRWQRGGSLMRGFERVAPRTQDLPSVVSQALGGSQWCSIHTLGRIRHIGRKVDEIN